MAAGGSSGNQQKLTVPAGSRVSCTTSKGEKVEGEVLAFDNHHKIIVLTLFGFVRSRLVDATSLTKHGLYVSKDSLSSFILGKAKAVSSNKEQDIPSEVLKVVESQTSQVNVISEGTNTEPYYLSLNKWHDAEWNTPQGKKHLPPRKDNYRSPPGRNKVKPIKTQYIDYNTMVK